LNGKTARATCVTASPAGQAGVLDTLISDASSEMRNKIKKVATELLIKNGVRGLRFGDIADRLDITRANIHYHFGTKKKLVEEVINDYVVDTLEKMHEIWADAEASYPAKVMRMMEFNRRRYARYNRGSREGRPWSLISRMRLEADQLSDKAQKVLRSFTVEIEAYMHRAVEEAQRKGELTTNAPLRDIAIQLISTVDSAGSITLDGGSFDRLERLYTAHMNIVRHAYGSDQQLPSGANAAAAEG
jgi:TetR/AcrR family transcriptional regulator, transcriptional repressor for nem operon